MSRNRDSEIGLPTIDEYLVLRETVFAIGGEPDASVQPTLDRSGVYIKLERLFVDLDFLVWPPLTICLAGLIRTVPNGEKMTLRYRELAHSPTTENSSLNHDYIFEAVDGVLIEFAQSIRACPSLPEQRQEILLHDEALDQAQQGRKLLKSELGNQLEITAGDCGVLFDRMVQLAC